MAVAENAAIIADGVALMAARFNDARSEKGAYALSDDEERAIADEMASLHEIFDGAFPDGWAETVASMVIGAGRGEREVELVREAARRAVANGRLGRDGVWCVREMDAFMVEKMLPVDGWNMFDYEDKEKTDKLVLEMCLSVGVDNLPNDWIAAVDAFVLDGEGLEYIPAARRVLERFEEIGEVPVAGAARDAAIAAYFAESRGAGGDDILAAKVAVALTERDIGRRLGGERSYEEWMMMARAVAAGERGRAILGDAYAPSTLDWLECAMRGADGAADACAALIWIEIEDELKARAGSTRALDLLAAATPMDIYEERSVFSISISGDSSMANEFWMTWAISLKTALARVLNGDCELRIYDRSMRLIGDG